MRDAEPRPDPDTSLMSADAANAYETLFVPALFGQWPPHLLAAGAVAPGDRFLDVGCGTGVLARAALERVGPAGAVTGLDRNEAMLGVARRLEPRITWHHGTADRLPFADATFDRVGSQFMLMFVDDPTAVVRELARVVRPGGTVTVSTWAALAESPGYRALAELVDETLGHDAGAILRSPFGLGDRDELQRVLAGAGADVEVRRVEGTGRFASVEAWVRTEIVAWTLAERVDDDQLAAVLRQAQRSLARFAGPDGSVEVSVPANVGRLTVAG